MSHHPKLTILVMSIAMLAIAATSANAETRWERNHPRRDQVNDRLESQNRRINQEYREGEITRGQAVQLHREDHAIRQEERTISRFDDGHITPTEQRALNWQEDVVSRQIGR